MSKAKILIYDVETQPALMHAFDIWNPTSHTFVLKSSAISCVCYKYLDERKIYSISMLDNKRQFKKDPYDDSSVLKAFKKVYDAADIAIAHNGDKFDFKVINTRLLALSMEPLKDIPTVDTLKVAKGKFRLLSNRLDYLGTFLGVGHKLKTSAQLWVDTARGDTGAMCKMVKYCKRDVQLLEDVYKKLVPYITNHPNMHLIQGYDGKGCPNCGSMDSRSNGIRFTRMRKYRRLQCKDCGASYKGEIVKGSKK